MSPRQPQTPTGRRLFTDNEPGDMLESDGVTWDDVCDIEAEAIAARDAELRAAVEGLPFAAEKHLPLADGSCLHLWRNRTMHFVKPCPYVDGWLAAKAAAAALLDQPVVPKP